MTNLIKLERGSVGNSPCALCNQMHVPQNKCSFEALAKKIMLLTEANRTIPSILQANKEAVTTARQFQILLKSADKANDILFEVLAAHGEIGETIKNEYLKGLDEWAKVHSSQDTEEQSQDTGPSILSETNDKPSTGETTPGGNSPLIL